MQPISEKWEVVVGKQTFVITSEEKDQLLRGINAGVKVVQFKDVIINPAFIQTIVMVERRNPNQLSSGAETPMSVEQVAKNKARLDQIRAQFGRNK